jgi:hypothetical protein
MEDWLGTRKRPERETEGAGGTVGEPAGRSCGPFDVLSKAHLAPGGARRIVAVQERKRPGGLLLRPIDRPEVTPPDRDFHIDIVV